MRGLHPRSAAKSLSDWEQGRMGVALCHGPATRSGANSVDPTRRPDMHDVSGLLPLA